MSNSVRKELCWYDMVKDVPTTVRDCRYCAQNCTHSKLQRLLKPFFSKGALEYIAIDILNPLPKKKVGSQFVFAMTDRYIDLATAIPTTKSSATTVARICFEYCVAYYSALFKLVTSEGLLFMSKFFVAIRSNRE